MSEPPPVLVADLFPEILSALLEVLSSLDRADWSRPTVAAAWSVHDVALHLLGDEINILSGQRDDWNESGVLAKTWEELVEWLNRRNGEWVQATRRISPPLLCDLLRLTGEQVCAYFRSLDPFAPDGTVSWAGPGRAPVWLDMAREYTERWHHQQHIRDAVGRPGLLEPRYLHPVLAAFVRALPQTYANVTAHTGACVTLNVTGPAGGTWSVARQEGRWTLHEGRPDEPDAELELPEQVAWRVMTKGMARKSARGQASVRGDPALALVMLDAISIIA